MKNTKCQCIALPNQICIPWKENFSSIREKTPSNGKGMSTYLLNWKILYEHNQTDTTHMLIASCNIFPSGIAFPIWKREKHKTAFIWKIVCCDSVHPTASNGSYFNMHFFILYISKQVLFILYTQYFRNYFILWWEILAAETPNHAKFTVFNSKFTCQIYMSI